MKHEFWHERWEKNEIGFHLDEVHPCLIRLLQKEALGQRVFVPLCGKTLDIGYLLDKGFHVVANELSQLAVDQLFAQLNLTPDVQIWRHWPNDIGHIYRAANLTVFVGDFFQLTPDDLGEVDWVYDRASVIALPDEMRRDYVQRMKILAAQAIKWTITLEYDQSEMPGPPFSVTQQALQHLYGDDTSIEVVEHQDILEQEPRFKARGLTSFFQGVYRVHPA